MASPNRVQRQEKDPPKPRQEKEPPKNLTNSIGMKFVWIPAGTFMMGSPKEEKPRDTNENQHKVTLTKGLYMGVYPVIQEQWKAVMGNNPSSFQFQGEKDLPMENVSWNHCQEFLKKLREKDKQPYRLPTEAVTFQIFDGTVTVTAPSPISSLSPFLPGLHDTFGARKSSVWWSWPGLEGSDAAVLYA